MSYFMVPLSVLGLALPWAMLSQLEGTSRKVFQVLGATMDAFLSPSVGVACIVTVVPLVQRLSSAII